MKVMAEFDVEMAPHTLAAVFCALSDEDQAQFFIECAKLAEKWDSRLGPDWQWRSVGRHLATCSCSTEEARSMVRSIARGAETE